MVSLHALASKIGQAASVVGAQFAKFAKDPVDHVRRGFSNVKSEAALFKTLLSLSPKDIKDAVSHLNEIMQALCFGNGEGVVFHLRHFNPESPVWKKSVHIACYKIDFGQRTAKITRMLNLRQFWMIRRDILQQTQFCLTKEEPTYFRDVAQASQPETSGDSGCEVTEPLNAATVLDRVNGVSEQECCICMENDHEVTLPCAHSFCKECIETWNDQHNTCPMCRNHICSDDEFWEIECAPNQEEFGQYLVRLASGS